MLESITSVTANRTWFGGLGTSMAAIGLVALGDSGGVLGAIVLVVCWYTLPQTFTVGLGTLMIATVAPTASISFWGIAVALGLGIILVEPAFEARELHSSIPLTIMGCAVLGAFSWVVFQSTDVLWPVAAVVVALGGFLLYAIHRYERAAFDQMEVLA